MDAVGPIPPLLDQAIRARLAAFEDALVRRRSGGITDDELRPIRLALCLHQEADAERYMLRVRVPGGEARAEVLDAIAALARAGRGVRPVHLTTRQCLQVHRLSLDEAPDAIRFLLDRGLATAGTCGNAVRNVSGCERAGICPDEVVDVRDLVRALSDALAVYPDHALPRKFKIGVSGCRRDCAASVMQDAGWVARSAESPHGPTFDLVGGGGLGARPREAVPLAEGVPQDRVVDVTRALIDLFDREGDRTNKKRARLKFVVQRLGAAEVRARLHGAIVPLPSALPDAPPVPPARRASDDPDRWRRTNVIPERRAGLHTCAVTVREGDLAPPQLEAVADVARRFGDGTVRLTPGQNLLLPGVAAERIDDVLGGLRERELADPGAGWASDPVSCPGEEVCGLAFTGARHASRALRARLAREPSLVDALGPCPVRVSGCPNGCGRHAVAAVGVQGVVRAGRAFYRIWLGPPDAPPRIGHTAVGAVFEEDLPERVVDELRARCRNAD